MLLYFGSITMVHEANACLCEVGHIWPMFAVAKSAHCPNAQLDYDAQPASVEYEHGPLELRIILSGLAGGTNGPSA